MPLPRRLKEQLERIYDDLPEDRRRFFWRAIQNRALQHGLASGSDEHAELYDLVGGIVRGRGGKFAERGVDPDPTSTTQDVVGAGLTAARSFSDMVSLGGYSKLLQRLDPEGFSDIVRGEETLAQKSPLASAVGSGVGTVAGLGAPLGAIGGIARATGVSRGLKALPGISRLAGAAEGTGKAGWLARRAMKAGELGLSFGALDAVRDPDVAAIDPQTKQAGFYRPGQTLPGTEYEVPGRLSNALHGLLFGSMTAPVIESAHFITPKLQQVFARALRKPVFGSAVGRGLGGALEFLGFSAVPVPGGHESTIQLLMEGKYDEAKARALAEAITGVFIKGVLVRRSTHLRELEKLKKETEAEVKTELKGVANEAKEQIGEQERAQREEKETQEGEQRDLMERQEPREEGDWYIIPTVREQSPVEGGQTPPYAYIGHAKDLDGRIDPMTAEIGLTRDHSGKLHLWTRAGEHVGEYDSEGLARRAGEAMMENIKAGRHPLDTGEVEVTEEGKETVVRAETSSGKTEIRTDDKAAAERAAEDLRKEAIEDKKPKREVPDQTDEKLEQLTSYERALLNDIEKNGVEAFSDENLRESATPEQRGRIESAMSKLRELGLLPEAAPKAPEFKVPKPTKARLIPTRRPDGGIEIKTEPVEEPKPETKVPEVGPLTNEERTRLTNAATDPNPSAEILELQRRSSARKAQVEALSPEEAAKLDHKEQQDWLAQRKSRMAGNEAGDDAMDAARESHALLKLIDNRIGMRRVESDLVDKLRDDEGMRKRGADPEAIKRAEEDNARIEKTLNELTGREPDRSTKLEGVKLKGDLALEDLDQNELRALLDSENDRYRKGKWDDPKTRGIGGESIKRNVDAIKGELERRRKRPKGFVWDKGRLVPQKPKGPDVTVRKEGESKGEEKVKPEDLTTEEGKDPWAAAADDWAKEKYGDDAKTEAPEPESRPDVPVPAEKQESKPERPPPKPKPEDKVDEAFEEDVPRGFGKDNTIFKLEDIKDEIRKLGGDIDSFNVSLGAKEAAIAVKVAVQTVGWAVEGSLRAGIKTYRWVRDRAMQRLEKFNLPKAVREFITAGLHRAYYEVMRVMRANGTQVDKPRDLPPKANDSSEPVARRSKKSAIADQEQKAIIGVLVNEARRTMDEAVKSGKRIDGKKLRKRAEDLTDREADVIIDEIQDSLEAALNEHAPDWRRGVPEMDRMDLLKVLKRAREVENLLPTRRRTTEQIKQQQFSTPFDIAQAAAILTGARPGDLVLEPTAGTAGLVSPFRRGNKVMAGNPPKTSETVNVAVNELDVRRRNVIEAQGFIARGENYLWGIGGAQPDVVVANFPWKVARPGDPTSELGLRDLNTRFALRAAAELRDGGRLVMVAPRTALSDTGKLQKDGNLTLQAIIKLPGEWYARRGTTTESHIHVYDKVARKPGKSPDSYTVSNQEQLAAALAKVRLSYPRAKQKARSEADQTQATRKRHLPGSDGESKKSERVGTSSHSDSEERELDHRRRKGFVSRTKEGSKLKSDVFVEYEVRSDQVAREQNTQHPRMMVETGSLASAPSPRITHQLHPETVKLNRVRPGEAFSRLSDQQLDAVAAAAQAHAHGHGILIGDDVGVGKTREIWGLITEHWNGAYGPNRKGHRRILVVTENSKLANQLLGKDFKVIFGGSDPLGNVSRGVEPDQGDAPFSVRRARDDMPLAKEPPRDSEGRPTRERIGYARHGFTEGVVIIDATTFKTHRESILEWEPTSLITDEADRFKLTNQSQQAQAWRLVHESLMARGSRENVDFTYLTATAATDVMQLKYLYGLRLWHPETFELYLQELTGQRDRSSEGKRLKEAAQQQRAKQGGFGQQSKSLSRPSLSAGEQEQIMRELKMRGRLITRDIWREGVEFNIHEEPLNVKERALVDKIGALGREILQGFDQFRGANKLKALMPPLAATQAAVKQYAARVRMQRAADLAQAHMEAGRQVVITTVNVSPPRKGKGHLHAAINQINEFSSKEDSVIPEAVALKDRLRRLADSDELREGGSIIDVFKARFGADNVRAITGSGEHKRGRDQAIEDFKHNRFPILIISRAGKRGANLHHEEWADHLPGSARGQRAMIITDYEWDAATFKQELGRVDRSGQLTSPVVDVISLASAIEKKFLATVSLRMQGLGIVGRGGADSTGTEKLNVYDFTSPFELALIRHAWMRMSSTSMLPPDRRPEDFEDMRWLFLDRGKFGLKRREQGKGKGKGAYTTEPKEVIEGIPNLQHEIGMALQLAPTEASDKWDAWVERHRREFTESETGQALQSMEDTTAKGRILQRQRLNELNGVDLVTVEAEVDEIVGMKTERGIRMVKSGKKVFRRYGILTGLFQHDDRFIQIAKQAMSTHTVSGKSVPTRRYAKLQDEVSGEIVSGLHLKPHTFDMVSRLYGAELEKRLRTRENLVRDLRAGDVIPVVPPPKRKGRKDWVLRRVSTGEAAGLIEVQNAGADLRNKETGESIYPDLVRWHSTQRWVLTESGEGETPWLTSAKAFLDRHPIDNTGVGLVDKPGDMMTGGEKSDQVREANAALSGGRDSELAERIKLREERIDKDCD